MEIWIILGVCAAVFAMAVAVAGAYNLVPSGMPPARDPDRAGRLPEEFSAEDVDGLVLTRELRGYHMGQVDDVLARLRDRIAHQDRLLARLGTGGASSTAGSAHTAEAERAADDSALSTLADAAEEAPPSSDPARPARPTEDR